MRISLNSRMGLIGMKNPDNICYLNTALQCLLAVRPLTDYFLEKQYFSDINFSGPESCFGLIAMRYAGLIQIAWCESYDTYDSSGMRGCLARYK
jgi:ubiquitin C-terminal hydrolase